MAVVRWIAVILFLAAVATAERSLQCGSGGPYTFQATSWSATCWVATANRSSPCWQNHDLTDRSCYSCASYPNIGPPTLTDANASIPLPPTNWPAGVACAIDPVAANASACGYVNGEVGPGASFPNGTAGQRAGNRALQIRGGVPPIENDWADDIGPPAGHPSACETAPVGHFPCRANYRPPNMTRTCAFPGIWWRSGFAQRAAASERFFAAYARAGGQLDVLFQDTEMGEGTWATGFAGAGAVPRACAEERWRAISADTRWPAALAELRRRGFDPGNTSAPDYLSIAMNVTLFTRDFVACRTQGCPYGCADPTRRAAVKQLCMNQVIFNQFVSEQFAAGWTASYFDPARKYFPKLIASDYGVSKELQQYCEIGGVDDGFYGSNCTAAINYSGAVVGNTAAPSLYAIRPRAFESIRARVYRLRAHAIAAAATRTYVQPWVTPIPFRTVGGAATSDRRWFVEQVFHLLLSAGAQGGRLFYFNAWFTLATQILPTIDTPDTDAALSAALAELDRLAGCANRSWVKDMSRRSTDSFLLTGLDVGGRRLWRFTPNETTPSSSDASGGGLGAPPSEQVTLGQPLPINQTTARCTMLFVGGERLSGSGDPGAYGRWYTTPAGIQLVCPELNGGQPLAWPLPWGWWGT